MKNLKKWWREKDNDGNSIIRFTVTSDGKTGPEWIKFFKDNKYQLGFGFFISIEKILNSENFVASRNFTYDVVVLKGNIVKDNRRHIERMFREGKKKGYQRPPIEIACLIREKFTNEEIKKMGLWTIVIMHEPVKDDHQESPHNIVVDRDEEQEHLSIYSCNIITIKNL